MIHLAVFHAPATHTAEPTAIPNPPTSATAIPNPSTNATAHTQLRTVYTWSSGNRERRQSHEMSDEGTAE